jgi:hypothetical protein
MKYPQGYLFLDESTQLPVLSTIQAWFTAKTEIYLPGVSPKSKLLDSRIAMLADIHQHITKRAELQMGCIVFNDTKLSQTFMLAHGSDIKKIYWIDSAEKARDIKELDFAIRLSQRFDFYADQCVDTYQTMAAYIFEKTGQTMVGDPDIQRFISGRFWGSTSEAEIHIRQIAKNETRAGVLVRLDLGAELEESNHAEV